MQQHEHADLIVRLAPDYANMPGYFDAQPVNSTLQPFIDSSSEIAPGVMGSGNGSNSTCAGEFLTYSQVAKVANAVTDPTSDFCDDLSQASNLTSGDLYQALTKSYCEIANPNATDAT